MKLSDVDYELDVFGKLKLELYSECFSLTVDCGEMLLLPVLFHPVNESIAVITANAVDSVGVFRELEVDSAGGNPCACG